MLEVVSSLLAVSSFSENVHFRISLREMLKMPRCDAINHRKKLANRSVLIELSLALKRRKSKCNIFFALAFSVVGFKAVGKSRCQGSA